MLLSPRLIQFLSRGYKARAAQLILFKVVAWDANCPQHIPQRFEAEDVAAALAERDRRIEALEARPHALDRDAYRVAFDESDG